MPRRWMQAVIGGAMLTMILTVAQASAQPEGAMHPAAGGGGTRPGPGPAIDPRRMSGIPRPDPSLAAGVVSVRCLHGGFDAPAVGVSVELEIRPVVGEVVTKTSTTGAEGRAMFEGLGPLIGGTAIARATFGGGTLASEPMVLDARVGTRVMLVQPRAETAGSGAAGSEGAAGPTGPQGPGVAAGPHAGHALPVPGRPFPLDRPKGVLVVGTLDLAARAAIAGAEVRVDIGPKEGAPVAALRRVGKTDAEGRIVFEGLVPPAIPEGSVFRVEATLPGPSPATGEAAGEADTGAAAAGTAGTDAAEVLRSEVFSLGDTGVAVVLTRGGQALAEPPEPSAPRARAALPGPRAVPSLGDGVVVVRLVDGADEPVANQVVNLVRKDVAGGSEQKTARSDAAGLARFEGVAAMADAFYFIGVDYDGAPYQSSFFEMHEGSGVAVDLRVYRVTSDPSVVKSALRFHVTPRENDVAEIGQVYEVFVQGELAYWPKGGLEIHGAKGAKGLVLVGRSQRFLEQSDKSAPFAKLKGPLAPGEVAHLTVAYLIDHDGSVTLDWTPPFSVVETSVVLAEGLALEVPKSAAPLDLPADHGAASGERGFALGAVPPQSPLHIVASGLPVGSHLLRWVALAVGLAIALAAGFALWFRPRPSRAVGLAEREAELWGRFARAANPAEKRRILVAIDALYHQRSAVAAPERDPG